MGGSKLLFVLIFAGFNSSEGINDGEDKFFKTGNGSRSLVRLRSIVGMLEIAAED